MQLSLTPKHIISVITVIMLPGIYMVWQHLCKQLDLCPFVSMWELLILVRRDTQIWNKCLWYTSLSGLIMLNVLLDLMFISTFYIVLLTIFCCNNSLTKTCILQETVALTDDKCCLISTSLFLFSEVDDESRICGCLGSKSNNDDSSNSKISK